MVTSAISSAEAYPRDPNSEALNAIVNWGLLTKKPWIWPMARDKNPLPFPGGTGGGSGQGSQNVELVGDIQQCIPRPV